MCVIAYNLDDLNALQNATYVGGGTDIMPLLKNKVRNDDSLVFLHRLKELKGIGKDSRYVYIGAGETLWNISQSGQLKTLFPALVQAANVTASPQIRNIATLGGNVMQDRRCLYFNQPLHWRKGLPPCYKTGGCVCHQIPNSPVCRAIYYSDTATALVLYEAEAECLENGVRSWVSAETLIARHSTANGFASQQHLPVVILRFRLPIAAAGEYSGFYKYAMRSTIDFPLFNVALRCGGACPARIVVGAIAPQPVLLTKTSAMLMDAQLNDETLLAAGEEELNSLAMPIREACIPPARKKDLYRHLSFLIPLRHKLFSPSP